MAEELIYLVYISSATHLFSEQELLALLDKARRRNEEIGITGMLLYSEGNFIQVIEGAETAVNQVHQAILQDPRHTNVLTLMRRTTTERLFPNWSMGFKNISQLTAKDTPGVSDFLDSAAVAESFRKNPSGAFKLLLSFRDKM